jgi:hypothetical protein
LARIANSQVVVGFCRSVRTILHYRLEDLPCLCKPLLTDEFRRNVHGLALWGLAGRDADVEARHH